MAGVGSQDLLDLLTVLYQGSVQRSPRAVEPAVRFNGARFFRRADLEALATDLALPVPAAGIDDTLRVGLSRGVFQSSLEQGTQCGFSSCDVSPPPLPTWVYAYHPNLWRIPANRSLLTGASALIAQAQQIQGSSVKFANNRAPAYNTRGSATFDRDRLATSLSSSRRARCPCRN